MKRIRQERYTEEMKEEKKEQRHGKRKGIEMQNKVAGLMGKGGTGYFTVGRVKLRSAGTYTCWIGFPLEACLTQHSYLGYK